MISLAQNLAGSEKNKPIYMRWMLGSFARGTARITFFARLRQMRKQRAEQIKPISARQILGSESAATERTTKYVIGASTELTT